jgi:hypothetical protein
MPRPFAGGRRSVVQRAARVAFAFIVMNVAAVAGLVAAIFKKRVWG